MLRSPGISLEVVEDMDVDNDDAAAMPRHLMLISLMKSMTDVTHWPKVHLCEAAVVDQEDMDGVMRLFSVGARIDALTIEGENVCSLLEQTSTMLQSHDPYNERNFVVNVYFHCRDNVADIAQVIRTYGDVLLPRLECHVSGRLPVRARKLFPRGILLVNHTY
jgi:hypothetical protein